MKNLYLVGGGGHCVSCIDVIRATGEFKIKGIFDAPEKVAQCVLGVTILGSDQDISRYVSEENYFLITVGQIKTPDIRIRIFEKLKDLGAPIATVVSPRAYVSRDATLGPGTIVMHDALVNANVRVGANCIINTKALVEHDVQIQDHCHISTAAIVNGTCHVGLGSFVGSNATLKESLQVPSRAVLSAGVFHR